MSSQRCLRAQARPTPRRLGAFGTNYGPLVRLVLHGTRFARRGAMALVPGLGCGGTWPGVDESVVKTVAEQAGRTPRAWIPLEGDLLLFAFLCAGILGGFALGYGYRALFVEARPSGTAAKP